LLTSCVIAVSANDKQKDEITFNVTYGDSMPLPFNSIRSKVGVSCRDGYFDLSAKSRIYFSRNQRIKNKDKPIIGDGTQLQCFDSTYCYCYALDSATCTNRGIVHTGVSWQCSANTHNRELELDKMSVQCEAQSYPGDLCVLDDSCALKYSFRSRGMSTMGIIGICVGVVAAIVLLSCCCSCCCRKDQGSVITTGSASTSGNYMNRPAAITTTTTLMPPGPQPFYPPPNHPPPHSQFQYQGAAPPMAGPAGEQPAYNPNFEGYPEPPPPYSATSPYPPKY